MDLGTSIALFLVIAIILLILFCLVTKYFQYRMNKKMQQQGQAFSQVDQISHADDQEVQGQYQQFLQKRKLSEQQKNDPKRMRDKAYLFQKTEVQEPMANSNQPIYGVSMLRRRLQGQTVQSQQPTGRSLPSIKSFRPQRLQTGRSSVPTNRGFDSNLYFKNPQQPIIKHEFISRLITYNEQGLNIMDVVVSALIKQGGKIREKKLVNTTIVNPRDEGFDDQLQVLGFEKNQFSCMRFKISTQIPYMIQNQEYPISSLKTSESKEQIDFSQYYMLKDKIQTSLQ